MAGFAQLLDCHYYSSCSRGKRALSRTAWCCKSGGSTSAMTLALFDHWPLALDRPWRTGPGGGGPRVRVGRPPTIPGVGSKESLLRARSVHTKSCTTSRRRRWCGKLEWCSLQLGATPTCHSQCASSLLHEARSSRLRLRLRLAARECLQRVFGLCLNNITQRRRDTGALVQNLL